MSLNVVWAYGNPLTYPLAGLAVGMGIVDPTGAVPGFSVVVSNAGTLARLYFPAAPPSGQDTLTPTLGGSGGTRTISLAVQDAAAVAIASAPIVFSANVDEAIDAAAVTVGAAALSFNPQVISATGLTSAGGILTLSFTGPVGALITWSAWNVGRFPGKASGSTSIPA